MSSSEGGSTPTTSSLVSSIHLNEVKAGFFRAMTLLSLEGVEQLASQTSQEPTVVTDTGMSTRLQDLESEPNHRIERDRLLMMHSQRSSAEDRIESSYSKQLAETVHASSPQHEGPNAAETLDSQ